MLTNERTRCYAFELYEENAPKNLKEELNALHIKTAYALHDKDIYSNEDLEKYIKSKGENPEWQVGETKKAHYHIVLKFDNVKSIKQILNLLKPFGVNYVVPVQNERGMIRYLIHLDDKDKYQYPKDNIFTLCDYQINKFFRGDGEMVNIKQELRNIILKDKSEYTYNYFDFYNYVMDNFDADYLDMIDKYSYSFQSLINGKNKKKEQEELKKAEAQRIKEQEQRDKEIEELTREAKRKTELKKLELQQKEYEKKERYKKTYLELKDRNDLDAKELELKKDIENFFTQYEKENDYKELFDQQTNIKYL